MTIKYPFSGTSGFVISLLLFTSLHASELPSPQVSSQQNQDHPTITMAFYADPKHNLYFRWGELLYTEAFARLGYQFSYQVVPAMRASLLADSGKVDGEPARVFAYGMKFQNLVRVEEPILETKLLAFARNPEIKLVDWDSLKQFPYRVEYNRGIFFAEQKLESLLPAERLTTSSSPVNSFRKLLHDRIDIYIDTAVIGFPLLQKAEFEHSKIHSVVDLETLISFAYLHKRHRLLAPKLSETLKQMKQEGLFELYLENARLGMNRSTSPQ
ncbi:hypothetical protein L9G16_04855 [Shewanella sp. A25]|nr:hypothetical protein [Shewanella shenzhenensis]